MYKRNKLYHGSPLELLYLYNLNKLVFRMLKLILIEEI